jgi:hypothetical protein
MEESGQLHAPAALYPWKERPVTIEGEAESAPEPIWTLWSRDKSVNLAENQTPAVHPIAHSYTVNTELALT